MSDEREERKEAFTPFYFICKTKFSSNRLFDSLRTSKCTENSVRGVSVL